LHFLQRLALDEEDALPLVQKKGLEQFRVAVAVYPRISNHTDVDPLRWHAGVDLRLVGPEDALPPADLVILPGSKNVRADLEHLRRCGWDEALRRHLRYGGKLLALCGGMQMLGRWIHDPSGVEGVPGSSRGLDLLDLETTLEAERQLRNVHGRMFPGSALEAPCEGYEVHMGTSRGPALDCPALVIDGSPDGALSADGQIFATYLHGLLDQPQACNALLRWAGLEGDNAPDIAALREASLERLADCVEREIDLTRLLELA
jgi:adenosylcobyric acid synthase